MLDHNKQKGRNVGRGAVPLSGGATSPSNTMWLGPRPTSIPSGILILPTVWPQYTNVTDRQDRQGPDSIGWLVLRSPKNRDAQKKQSSHKVSRVSPEVGPSEGSLRWERFVKEVGFEPEVKERGSY